MAVSRGRRTAGRAQSEAGGVSPFVVVMVVPLMIAAGLVYDGGLILAERRQVTDVAQQAALAGAQAVAGTQARQGTVDVEPSVAATRARKVARQLGYEADVQLTGDSLRVRVSNEVNMRILGIAGMNSRTVEGSARVQLVRGVDAIERRQGS